MLSLIMPQNDRLRLCFLPLHFITCRPTLATKYFRPFLLYLAEFVKLKEAILENFGTVIKKLRLKQELLLRQVAAALDVDTSMVSKFEKGERFPTREQLRKMAALFRVPLDKLLINSISDRLTTELAEEPLAIEILKVAQAKVRLKRKILAKNKDKKQKEV